MEMNTPTSEDTVAMTFVGKTDVLHHRLLACSESEKVISCSAKRQAVVAAGGLIESGQISVPVFPETDLANLPAVAFLQAEMIATGTLKQLIHQM